MPLIGYARVSSDDQDLSIQLAALKAAGCSKIFAEKQSGTSTSGREQLDQCLDYVRDHHDTLVVTRIDRLARSLRDLSNIVHDLETKGVGLVATEQPVDTTTAAGKAFLGMLGVFAEFETNIRRDRQMEGVRRAQAEGKYKGRAPAMNDESRTQARAMAEQGVPMAVIARKLGIARSTLYKHIGSDQRATHSVR